MDDLIHGLLVERQKPMARWTMTSPARRVTTEESVDHGRVPVVPVDINAAAHRQVLLDLNDAGLREWRAV